MKSIGVFDVRHTLAVIACWVMASSVSAQDGETIDVLSYTPPETVEMGQASYPTVSARRRDEGWVMLNFMVDTDGNPYEPMVVGSSGDRLFEQAGIKAVLKSKFQPAVLDGEDVDGSRFFKYTFTMTGGTGASRSFIRKHNNFNGLLSEGELDEAAELLDEMEELAKDNLYEDAFVNLSKFFLARKYGDTKAQMDHLSRAVAYASKSEKRKSFLSDEMLPIARAELFRLEFQNSYYAAAMKTFEWMKDEKDEKYTNAFRQYYDQIVELAADDSAYSVEGQIDGLLPWYIDLHKRGLIISDVIGHLDEFKLRCEGNYVAFAYTEEAQFSIPESWGSCTMQVIGDPGTTFSLIQLPPEN